MSSFDHWWEEDEKSLQSRTVKEWARAGWDAGAAEFKKDIVDLARENKFLREGLRIARNALTVDNDIKSVSVNVINQVKNQIDNYLKF